MIIIYLRRWHSGYCSRLQPDFSWVRIPVSAYFKWILTLQNLHFEGSENQKFSETIRRRYSSGFRIPVSAYFKWILTLQNLHFEGSENQKFSETIRRRYSSGLRIPVSAYFKWILTLQNLHFEGSKLKIILRHSPGLRIPIQLLSIILNSLFQKIIDGKKRK